MFWTCDSLDTSFVLFFSIFLFFLSRPTDPIFHEGGDQKQTIKYGRPYGYLKVYFSISHVSMLRGKSSDGRFFLVLPRQQTIKFQLTHPTPIASSFWKVALPEYWSCMVNFSNRISSAYSVKSSHLVHRSKWDNWVESWVHVKYSQVPNIWG